MFYERTEKAIIFKIVCLVLINVNATSTQLIAGQLYRVAATLARAGMC